MSDKQETRGAARGASNRSNVVELVRVPMELGDLTAEQYEALAENAANEGVSIATYIVKVLKRTGVLRS
jgi:hypothetical protein